MKRERKGKTKKEPRSVQEVKALTQEVGEQSKRIHYQMVDYTAENIR